MVRRFLSLAIGFFVLYALTAQRGLGWSGSDSAEFQSWVLSSQELICGPHFSNAHPFYILFARLFASTPFQVTMVSSFFGALAVGGFFLCTKRFLISVLFGLSHMLWWNSALAEVQTMNLAFTVFELYFILSKRFALAALLAGLHLGVHNFGLVNLPIYAWIFIWSWWRESLRRIRSLILPVAAFFVGAAFWLYHLYTRGAIDVLVGDYGAKVSGWLPENPMLTAFNLALSAISFFVPVAIVWWNRKSSVRSALFHPPAVFLLALFSLNFLFFIRYFVPDQATFLLPTLLFAYLLVAQVELKRCRFLALATIQILLPLMAYEVLAQLPRPDWKTPHEGRDDAAYFAMPWKVGVAK